MGYAKVQNAQLNCNTWLISHLCMQPSRANMGSSTLALANSLNSSQFILIADSGPYPPPILFHFTCKTATL